MMQLPPPKSGPAMNPRFGKRSYTVACRLVVKLFLLLTIIAFDIDGLV